MYDMGYCQIALRNIQGDPEGLGLGSVDLDFGSFFGWWAATMATYCPNRMKEHLTPISTQPMLETFWVTLYFVNSASASNLSVYEGLDL